MPLPNDSWFDIIGGPSTWKVIKSAFRDVEEEDAGLGRCVFTVRELGNPKPLILTVWIETVGRRGTYGRMIYHLEGVVLRVDGEDLVEKPGWETWFKATFIPSERSGSLKTSQQLRL